VIRIGRQLSSPRRKIKNVRRWQSFNESAILNVFANDDPALPRIW
jgi:hypothetical protein